MSLRKDKGIKKSDPNGSHVSQWAAHLQSTHVLNSQLVQVKSWDNCWQLWRP